MDAATLKSTLDKLATGGASLPKDEVLAILKTLNDQVKPTEDLLRATKAGNTLTRFNNTSTDAEIKQAASDVLNSWKKAIREQKDKRKREEEERAGSAGVGTPGSGAGAAEEERGAKRVKAENGAPSLDAKSSVRDEKPASSSAVKDEKSAIGSKDDKPSSSLSKDMKPPTSTPDVKSKPKVERDVKPLPSRKLSVNETEYADNSEATLDTIDPTLKGPRSAKSDNVADRIRADTDGGEPDTVRDKCVIMMYDAIALDSNAATKLLQERAAEIERAVFDHHSANTGTEYRAKIRSLFLNIKNKDNAPLRDRITKGLLTGKKVVTMSNADFASNNIRIMNEQLAEQNLFKAKSVAETGAETDAFKCGKCGERKTTYYQMQTRSADEPMTTFVTCKVCNNRWKFS